MRSHCPNAARCVLYDFSTTLRLRQAAANLDRAILNVPLLEEAESDWWQQTLFQYLGKRQPN
jgi:hypothetical protein